ncbi:FtsK/SpoIIIE domain-containing protein [Actinoplanes rectilineatus]|uniref:FtsK/SpoIIIE domain-containing protein n=1 Tax=Actinoplanes rectilineatus TaxID=113571 RepID=UPI0005F2C1A4|nr:FtsK/SpoIIIE domain-containing protein [Actinoplanes rectilineatus]
MRFCVTVVDPFTDQWTDLVITADGRSTVSDLTRRLRDFTESDIDRLFVDGAPLDPGSTLVASSLRAGSIVGLGAPVTGRPAEVPGLLEIRVTAGPAIGSLHRLTSGAGDLGSSAGCWIAVTDPAIPAVAARLTVDVSGRARIEPVPGATVEHEGEPVEGRARWRVGEQVTVGASVLELAEYTMPDAVLHHDEDGLDVAYNRPPRILPPARQTTFRLPTPPPAPAKTPLPWIVALLPLVGSIALAVVTGHWIMLVIAILSPVSLIGNHLFHQRHGKESYAEKVREYRDHRDRVEADVREAVLAERRERRYRNPDPAAAWSIASGPRHRLWERRRRDGDFLQLRVGSAVLPSDVTVEDPQRDEHRRATRSSAGEVPVTIPLREHGVVGIAGADDTARALGRWAVAQTAVLHSPTDVQLVILTDPTGESSWDWVRWLPHTRASTADGPAVTIGTDADSVSRRVAELLETIVRRSNGRSGSHEDEPAIVVVLDGARRLRSLPGVVQLLKAGPTVGVHAICLDDDHRRLPAECQAVVEVTGAGLRVTRTGADELTAVRPEYLAPDWCARVARILAPLRDISDEDDDSVLPSSSRLLDVLGLEPPAPEGILAGWQLGGRSTSAVIGESYDGPFAIDLRRDGPHGLIAGTTGSGKSELLQTMVATLAVANRPDAMTFVLVDYKGGSAFGDCVRLPHTVGMVTDLDEHLVRRALESLGAELRRREHILADAGAKDIDDYVRTGQTLPRLLIVIDEFASMVRDLPDFVTGLVNIAQRGRSLGIHLLLATQRPGGVVSPEIRANTNLRIALRVTDAAESQDVIESPEASRIGQNTPGRAYVRLGHASLVPFQSARVGGRRPGQKAVDLPPPDVQPLTWNRLGRAVEITTAPVREDRDDVTDLQELVRAISAAAAAAGIGPQHSPWLPALGTHLTLPSGYAVEDVPSEQAQRVATVELDVFGHLVAAGAPRTGRSQLLRTMAGSLAATHSTADVHVYGLDCGSGALLPLSELPHCGAVVTRTQVERSVRLIRRFEEEIRRRQEVLATGRFADIAEQRAASAPESRLPHLFLFLDGWEGFLATLGELDAGVLTDSIFRFLREGASVGVHLVVSGDRSVLTGRIATLTEDKLAFRMPDPGDMSLIGIPSRHVPQDMPPGRALRSGSGIEMQVALLDGEASGSGQAAALTRIGQAAQERDASVPASLRPFRLGEMPTTIRYAEITLPSPAARPGWLLVGVGGDQLEPLGPTLTDGVPAFAVGGPPKSGRSTALAAMLRYTLDAGRQAIVLAPRTSPLREAAAHPGVAALFTGPDVTSAAFTEALGRLGPGGLIVIDDAEALRDVDAGSDLRVVLRGGDPRGLAVVFGGTPEELCAGFSGWLVDARKSRRGLMLSPQNRNDGELVGARLPRTVIGQPVHPGRGLLYLGDSPDPVVVQVPC